MRARVVTSGDIAACPKFSLLTEHYRDDGTCRCGERQGLMQAIEDAETELRRVQALLALLKEQLRTA